MPQQNQLQGLIQALSLHTSITTLYLAQAAGNYGTARVEDREYATQDPTTGRK